MTRIVLAKSRMTLRTLAHDIQINSWRRTARVSLEQLMRFERLLFGVMLEKVHTTMRREEWEASCSQT